ncbi:MAG: eL32 family ribosomal protein [Candidatus Nanoarchaeia archaeon]
MKKQIFVRSESHKYSRLGVRRKKKQVYRRARGGENKVRLKKRGRLRNVSIGFRSKKATRGLVQGLKPILVHNIQELKNIKKGEIAIVAKIGKKKKLEIAKYALEKNIKLENLNPKRFIRKTQNLIKQKKEDKLKTMQEKKIKLKEAEEKAKELEKKEEKQENENKENENEPKK